MQIPVNDTDGSLSENRRSTGSMVERKSQSRQKLQSERTSVHFASNSLISVIGGLYVEMMFTLSRNQAENCALDQ